MPTEFRDEAKPLADEIVHKIEFYLKFEMKVRVTEHDLSEMNRLTKSIIVQHLLRKK